MQQNVQSLSIISLENENWTPLPNIMISINPNHHTINIWIVEALQSDLSAMDIMKYCHLQ